MRTVYYELGDYKFEWDEDKAEKNLRKHGIAFEDAALAFLDDNYIDDFDELHSDFEDRYKIVGRINGILAVIYTERGERDRLISARQADKGEKEDYYEQFYY